MQSSETGTARRARDTILRILILTGMVPAIMTSLIAPKNWVPEFATCLPACAPSSLVEPFWISADGDTVVPIYTLAAIAALAVGLTLAALIRSRRSALSLTPLALFAARGWIDDAADQALALFGGAGSLHAGEWLYHVSTSVLFLSFVFARGRVIRTAAFAIFALFLVSMIFAEPVFGFSEFLFFFASFVGARMILLFVRTNLDVFVRIGWLRSFALLGKSLLLMLPIWGLIGLGIWVQSWAAGVVAEIAYGARPLCAAEELRKAAQPGSAYFDAAATRYADAAACPEDEAETLVTVEEVSDGQLVTLERPLREIIREQASANLPALHRTLAAADPCSGETPPDTGGRDLETDLCYHAEFLHAGRAEAMRKALEKREAEMKGQAADARTAARAAMNEALPPVRIYRNYPCDDFPWLPCEIGKSVRWITDRAVNGAISRVRNSVSRNIQDRIAEAEGAGLKGTAALAKVTDDIAAELRRATLTALRNGFDLMGVIDHLLFVSLMLAIIKSLLFVFARVVFSSVDRETAITFCEPGETIAQGRVTNQGRRYALPGRGTFFYSKRGQMEGIAPKLAVPPPQMLACPLSRLFGGAYFLSRADLGGAEKREVVFKTGDIREFVEWQLAENEEVIFHFKEFIAMDESVKLSTYVSFRISTLLVGRLLFRRATGPGRLVLRTGGAAETTIETDIHLSKPVHRLVAWNRGARFKLDVEQNFVDIYFSTVHLRREPGDLVVFVAESDERKTYGTGLARFVKTFLLPI